MELITHKAHASDVMAHFYKMYRESMHCDINLVAEEDGKMFSAHKLVVMATSKYLHTVIMQNLFSDTLNIATSGPALEVILEFCYTGQIYVSSDRWLDVYKLAACFQVVSLVELMKYQTATLDPLFVSPLSNVSINGAVTSSFQEHYQTTDNGPQCGDSKLDETVYEISEDETGVVPHSSPKVVYETLTGQQDMSLKSTHHHYSNRTDPLPEMPSKTFILCHEKTFNKSSAVNTSSNAMDGLPEDICENLKGEINEGEISRVDNVSNSPVENAVCDIQNALEQVDNIVSKSVDLRLRSKSTTQKKSISMDLKNSLKCKLKKSRATRNECLERTNMGWKPGSNVRKGLLQTEIYNRRESKSRMLKMEKDKKTTSNRSGINKRALVPHTSIAKIKHFHKLYVPSAKKLICKTCQKVCLSYIQYTRHCYSCHQATTFTNTTRAAFLTARAMKRIVHRKLKIQYYTKSLQLGQYGKTFCKGSSFSIYNPTSYTCRSIRPTGWMYFLCKRIQSFKDSVKLARNRKTLHQIDEQFTRLKSATSVEKGSLFTTKHEGKPRCTLCRKVVPSTRSLQSHMKQVHKTESTQPTSEGPGRLSDLFQCPDCCIKHSTLAALLRHLVNVHQYTYQMARSKANTLPTGLMCQVPTCSYSTCSLDDMTRHVFEAHPFIKYTCDRCHEMFKVEFSYHRHLTACDKSPSRHQCSQCEKTYPKQHYLRIHEYWKHGIHCDTVKVYRCEKEGCDYKGPTLSALKVHSRKHVVGKNYKCEHCDMKLKTKIGYQKHKEKKHLGIRPFLCQVCGTNFGEDSELKSHMNIRHSTEKPFVCEHCDYSTAVKATFYTHLFNVHKVRASDDKRKLYECPHCDYTSILHYRFKVHLNTHTGTREYSCRNCGKGFSSTNALRTHRQWIHSDMMYSCGQCSYSTKTTQKLNEHIRVQHQLKGYKPYKCPYCAFTCATGGNTRKHVKQVHKGQPVTYLRDNDLIVAARKARASGHFSSLSDVIDNSACENKYSLDESQLHIVM